jgi:transcriptional regulator with XRE-family HTH domain
MIAQALRQQMQEQGMRLTDLAQAVGVSKSAVSQWMHGETVPRKKLFPKIAEFLHCPVEELLGVPIVPPPKHKRRVKPEEAAQILECSAQLVRQALQQGKAGYGYAVETSPGHYEYHISRKQLEAYIGDF